MVDRHREVWNSLGSYDPDWAVLSDPEHRYHGWDDDLDRFYASGRDEVADVLEQVAGVQAGAALDWGAGTGRLSFALSERFRAVTAYDHSESMLSTLEERATARSVTNVRTTSELGEIADRSFDLVLSLLVLQHLPNRAAVTRAIRQMCAVTRPGGWIVVEIPAHAETLRAVLQPRYRMYRLLRLARVPAKMLQSKGISGISMVTVGSSRVRQAFEAGHATVRHTISVPRPDTTYSYVRYFAQRLSEG
jgi:2-polyprenyl-3-methyl-5-hydroxy-6-metoxy-1,4-benzoquinol methylase